jgi:hypothetical protein
MLHPYLKRSWIFISKVFIFQGETTGPPVFAPQLAQGRRSLSRVHRRGIQHPSLPFPTPAAPHCRNRRALHGPVSPEPLVRGPLHTLTLHHQCCGGGRTRGLLFVPVGELARRPDRVGCGGAPRGHLRPRREHGAPASDAWPLPLCGEGLADFFVIGVLPFLP